MKNQLIIVLSILSLSLAAQDPGCTDSTACNYNPFATTDDGSCYYTSCQNGVEAHLEYTTGQYGDEQAFTITNSSNTVIWSVSGLASNSYLDTTICLPDNCFTLRFSFISKKFPCNTQHKD